MGQGMIHKLIGILMSAVRSLGGECPCDNMEKIAVIINRVMSFQSRRYHTLEHVFGFLDDADAIMTLAAIFHDLVYYQIDGGLPPELEPILGPYLVIEDTGPRVVSTEKSNDKAFTICRRVFGLERKRGIRQIGLNEFLSALAMAKLMESTLSEHDITAIAVCIEASIPFRGRDATGKTIGEVMEDRLRRAHLAGVLNVSDAEADTMIQRAITFANIDVKDFALDDPGEFLSNTWKLLPESNVALRYGGTFTVREYRIALQKMLGFFRALDPASIYHDYKGIPDYKTMANYETASRRNLKDAETYLQAKLLATGILEAIAGLSGGDAPMALFMGDLPYDGIQRENLLSFLPPVEKPAWQRDDDAVYRLLKDGRLHESPFDLKNSPFSLFLYHRMEPEAWRKLTVDAESFFAGMISAEDFLNRFDPETRDQVIDACAKMVPTRIFSLSGKISRPPSNS